MQELKNKDVARTSPLSSSASVTVYTRARKRDAGVPDCPVIRLLSVFVRRFGQLIQARWAGLDWPEVMSLRLASLPPNCRWKS